MTAYLTGGGGLGGLFGGTGCATIGSSVNAGWITQTSSATTTATSTMFTTWNQQQGLTQSQVAQIYLQQQAAQQNSFGAFYQQQCEDRWQALRLASGEYELPDGAKLVIDSAGNYKILDEEAHVVYLACRIREFNPYINASDLLEAFIEEVGRLDGVDQSDVLGLPIEAFINWIILQAAKRDGDRLDGLPSVETALIKHARCTDSGCADIDSFVVPENMALHDNSRYPTGNPESQCDLPQALAREPS